MRHFDSSSPQHPFPPFCMLTAFSIHVCQVSVADREQGGPDKTPDAGLSNALPISEGEEGDGQDSSRVVEHNGVSVEKHRWTEHTDGHDPCADHRCSPSQTCRVVKNPVLQFPVAVCEDPVTPGKKMSCSHTRTAIYFVSECQKKINDYQ